MAAATGPVSASVFAIDAKGYARHALHSGERAWPESNCYVDLCIEVLHAAGVEPLACLGFTLANDFEGDQFTFFKPPFGDMLALYGIEIVELNLWRSLLDHALVQLSRGRLVLAEMDAFYLPDTNGTDYKSKHTKTTIGINALDRDARTLGYFHNAGYYTLSGEDFDGVFQINPKVPETCLPSYVEFVKRDHQQQLAPTELLAISLRLAAEHYKKRPAQNPIKIYRPQLERDVAWLFGEGLATYHVYAFSTLRQLGANFELAARYVRWLGEQAGPGQTVSGIEAAAEPFDLISSSAKALILKLARAVNGKKAPDLSIFDAMEGAWEQGMAICGAHLPTR
jgi:hypothetical protein